MILFHFVIHTVLSLAQVQSGGTNLCLNFLFALCSDHFMPLCNFGTRYRAINNNVYCTSTASLFFIHQHSAYSSLNTIIELRSRSKSSTAFPPALRHTAGFEFVGQELFCVVHTGSIRRKWVSPLPILRNPQPPHPSFFLGPKFVICGFFSPL